MNESICLMHIFNCMKVQNKRIKVILRMKKTDERFVIKAKQNCCFSVIVV